MRSLLLSLVAASTLLLSGCFTTYRTIYTPLPMIPLDPAPALPEGDAEAIQVLGTDAMKSRRLIKAYNSLATEHNLRHGLEAVGLEAQP